MQKTFSAIGCKIIHLVSTDSTNNYLAKLIKGGETLHGTVVMADEQTQGRGQRGTVWHSPQGANLIFSVYVEYKKLSIDEQVVIHHWASVSTSHMLQRYNLKSEIKWPNDILIEGKKIAGILIENTIAGQNVKSSIIGIGLNVNQQKFDNLNACSLYTQTKQKYNVQEIALSLIYELNNLFKYIENKQFDYLEGLYFQNMWKINKSVDFIRNKQTENGVIRGVDRQGKIQIQTIHGLEVFDLKEIEFIR